MSYYQHNRKRARTINSMPTETDQSQARETDINVIVGRFLKNGVAPGSASQPIHGMDWTQFPHDLREFIETGRRIDEHRANLPEPLRNKTTPEILALTPEELTRILTPPAQPPANTPSTTT